MFSNFSDYSNSSVPYSVKQLVESISPLSSSGVITVSLICVGIIFFLLLVLLTLYFVYSRNWAINTKTPLNQISPIIPVELANIRELPLSPAFIDVNNPIYQMYQTPTDEELDIIPKIKRCQITLTKFLGSGAFGEVYEGQVQDLNSDDGECTKIAVKTLRKGKILLFPSFPQFSIFELQVLVTQIKESS